MATSFVSLGGVPMTVPTGGTPIRFSLYRGWDVREQVIQESTLRFAEYDAVFKTSPRQRLVIDDGDGLRVNIPVRILRIDPVDSDVMEIVLTDERMELVRVVNTLDFNVLAGTQSRLGADGQLFEFTRSFLRGTNTLSKDPSDATINILDAIIYLFAQAKEEWKTPIPLFDFDGDALLARMAAQRIPVNLLAGGLTLLDALRAVCEPYEIDLFFDRRGMAMFLDNDSSVIPKELAALDWKDEVPPFAQKIGGAYSKPKKLIFPFHRMEEIELELPAAGERPPGEHPRYILEQVYNLRSDWLDVVEYPGTLRIDGGFPSLLESYVVRRFFSNLWEETPYQQYPKETSIVEGLDEADRLALALAAVAEIRASYRRAFRITYLPSVNERQPAAAQVGLWNGANERGQWFDLRFGSIRIPGISAPDVQAEAEAAGETPAEHALRMVSFKAGPAVYCNWIDFLSEPDIDRRDPLAEGGIKFARNNTSARGIPVAPFFPRWESEDDFVIELVPLAGHGIRDRMPGLLVAADINRLAIAGDPGNPGADEMGEDLIKGADTPDETVPKLQEDPRIVVKMTGVRRTPVGSRKRFYEVEVDAFKDGNEDFWALPVDPTKFALFSTGDPSNPNNEDANGVPREIDFSVPINLGALKSDAERRAEQIVRRLSAAGFSTGTCDGLGAAMVKTYGAVSEVVIDIGTVGHGVVSTTVQVGGFALGRGRLNLRQPAIAGGAD